MQSTTRVALDAMGGDNAPAEVVKGAVDAVNKRNDIKIFLIGQKVPVERELSLYTYPKEQIEIVDAPEVIEMAEPPVVAIRRKKQSSIVVGMNMVKNKEADAFVSAGSSGAVLVGGQVIVGRIKGIQRPPLAPLIPTERGVSLLIDCGANVDARAEHLVQFAKMGSIYMEHVVGVKNPKVALVNIGAEEEKGNALVKETMPLLRECTDINFVGSIEARDIPKGDADVIVCEAFTGNVILKLYEGLSSTLIGVIKKGLMSTLKSKIGAALALPALKNTLKSFDATEYGGAPLLGLNGLVVKTHGSSKAKEITNSVFQCVTFKEKEINDKIKTNINEIATDFTVSTNEGAILQVLINLIDNSIYWLHESKEKDKKLFFKINQLERTIIIADNGCGVREDVAPFIFEEFVSMKADGRGLGLYIVKELLYRMNSEIYLLNNSNDKILSGANFIIKFKQEEA